MNSKMKILIAYDGSSWADAALADLPRAGLPAKAEVLVFSVADVWLLPESTSREQFVDSAFAERMASARKKARAETLQAVEDARALAVHASETVQALFPAWEVRAEACADSPVWGLIKKAEEWKPDLVVVGSHGRSAVNRLILGSVSQKVVSEVRCTVRVARGRMTNSMAPIRLVVGVDGSPDADVAVRAVAERVWQPGSEVHLLVILDQALRTMVDLTATNGDDARAQGQKIGEVAAEKLRTAGLVVSPVVKEGDPKRVLVEEAEQWGADCIFVGARGLGRLERFLLGSVSTFVSAHAPCSVEIVHPRPLQ